MILDKMFGGQFIPGEAVVPKCKEYKELIDEISDLVVKLEKELPEEQYELVDRLHAKVSEISGIDAEEYFKYGFSAGVILMMEIYQFMVESKKD